LLQYKLNPDFIPNANKPVVLKGLTIMANYTDARASGVQTKPSGTHLKEKHLVYWRLGDVTLPQGADWQKIVCRIIGAENAEPKPGNVEARWEYISSSAAWDDEDDDASRAGGISISRKREDKGKGKATADDEKSDSEDDPFADESAAASPRMKDSNASWQLVATARKIVSGKYEAK
jgi:F-BAR domain only protein